MFRQTKRRVAGRRNFEGESDTGSSNHFIFGSDGLTTEKEKELYSKIYESKVSFYELPPQGEITLDQFETWAIDRLKVLLEIESCVSRNKNVKEIESIVKPQLAKYLPFNTDNFEDKKKDYYSHFILRLCFCRSKELRDKFVRSETLLFKIKFNMMTSTEQIKFVKSLNLPYLQFISDEEKKQYSNELYYTMAPFLQFQLNLSDETSRKKYFRNEKFIKLPFENVIELVGSRQVFLHNGYAYLPQSQQLNLLTNEFAGNLHESLLQTYQYLPRLNEDDRLLPILTHLSSGYMINDEYISSSSNANDQDQLTSGKIYTKEVYEHFPLCMRNLLDGLQKTHHLRYNGRQQLSLFLKGIGLSCDEALKFWSEAFALGNITTDKFNKEYRYNFRHNYGLEGNRINYKPWDCRTILSKPRPARGEYHGCPYRDFQAEKLSMELNKMNLTKVQINDVLDSCQKTEYTVACTKVFEYTHGKQDIPLEQSHISHPNLYYDRSKQMGLKQ